MESVKEVTIGNTVTTIGENAFYGFSGIKTLIIPSSVKTIQDNAFVGCTSLEELTVEDSQDVLSCGNNGTQTSLGSYSVSYLGLFSDSPLKKLYLGRNITYAQSDNDRYWNSYSPFRNKETNPRTEHSRWRSLDLKFWTFLQSSKGAILHLDTHAFNIF